MAKRNKLNFSVECFNDGWRFTLSRKGILRKSSSLTFDEWPHLAASHPGVGLLLGMLDADEAAQDETGVLVPHKRIAKLSSGQAATLSLPPNSPFTLFLSARKTLNDPDFAIQQEWSERGGGPLFGIQRQGTQLRSGSRVGLILDPMYSLLQAIDELNGLQGDGGEGHLDRRMLVYAQFREQLELVTGDAKADQYLRGMVIHHATGIGVDLETGEGQAVALNYRTPTH